MKIAYLFAHLLIVSASFFSVSVSAEFEQLAESPYPTQHANIRNTDHVPYTSPTALKLKWKALEDSTVLQGCTTNNGQIYCVLAWNKEDRCNLVALDEKDGSLIWEDRINGQCLLDAHATLTNPVIDHAGNLYINDSEQIVSFTSEGSVRWINKAPQTLTSRKGLPNTPFGLQLLSTGELVTTTLGDGWILFVDSQTGQLTRKPFDLPAEKRQPEKSSHFLLPNTRPEGFLENLASPEGAELIWNFAFGESDYETDNNTAIDEDNQVLYISSGAAFPNKENRGALWAISYANEELSVAFYVELDVPGGIATSPTLTRDKGFVLIGDADNNLITVNTRQCLKLPSNSRCDAFTAHPVHSDLTSSVIVTDNNRVILPAGRTGYAAYDLTINDQGEPEIREVWKTRLSYLPTLAVAVHLAFDNVVWVPVYDFLTQDSYIVALDIDTGHRVSQYESGDAANVTMASDGKTILANNLSFTESLFKGRMGFDVKGGVWAWEPETAVE